MDYKKLLYAKANHRERDILDTFINNGFHPMKSKLRSKAHFLYRMVKLMEVPHPGHAMQHSMDIPLDKIRHHKQHKQLSPYRPGVDLYGDDILQAKAPQKIIEQLN